MAGAVSAGAYTAGVIDYLLEALEHWEQAKARNRALPPEDPAYDHSIPMHNVVIEVLGGASAGAMTAAVMTMALSKGITPIRIMPQGDAPTGNLLYDAWVGLNDTDEQLTLEQMFNPDDLRQGKPLRSILNSLPIRRIGKRAMEAAEPGGPWPAYVSRDLQVMLTLSNLRGIPISMAFQPSGPGDVEQVQTALAKAKTVDEINQAFADHPGAYHTMHVHKTTAHFGVQAPGHEKTTAYPSDSVMPIDLTQPDDRQKLVDYAIASGAFPIALSPVDFASEGSNLNSDHRPAYAPPRSYFLEQLRRMFPQEADHLLSQVEQSYHYTAVDGGTLNNEPFGEVMSMLRQKGDKEDNFALLVIDPFPSTQQVEQYEFPDSMAGVASQLIGALRQQAMVKGQEIRQGFEDDYTVAMIMPSRQEVVDGKSRPAAHPIACGSLEGFGGFFHRPFREHDFFLGRKNCQSFLRQHFTASHHQLQRAGVLSAYLDKQTRTRSMTAPEIDRGGELYRRFAIEKPQTSATTKARGGLSAEKAVEDRFPIIPDLSIDKNVGARAIRMEAEDAIPNYESVRIDRRKLWAYKPSLQQRVKGILDHYLQWPIPDLGMTLRTLSVISLIAWLVMLALLLLLPMPPVLVGIVSLFMSVLATPLLVVWVVRPVLIRLVSAQVFKVIAKQLKKHGLVSP